MILAANKVESHTAAGNIKQKLNMSEKLFIRLLKELGIFKLWVNNRTSYLERNGCNKESIRKNIFSCVHYGDSFRRIIDEGLIWRHTDCEKLWEELYSTEASCYAPLVILNDFDKLKKLKEKVKTNLKFY